MRCGPAITRSIASVNSSRPTVFLLRRAARIAASLTRFSRSAPEKPGVCRARFSIETSSSSGLPRAWTSRIATPALDVGPVENHLPVEPPGPEQRRIEHVRPVRRGDDDHVRAAVEAVHLDQDLVQRLLALVVAAAESGAALAANRVDLVDKDDAGSVLLRLIEEIADAAGADADEHLDELRPGDAEERHARFARDRPREQRLAGSRRTDQQHAPRDPRAERWNLSGYLRNSTTSTSSSFASSTPATSANVTVGLLPVKSRARLLPNEIA